ncbi:NAD(P)H-binding protein [Fructobacillus sp. M158]|uniref:NAD(P)H-binding protein n=1 Tax=Fructobacillus parabroussonetiae TaxID=2713174 RepID=UPI00200B28D2|nr:NAD(P)H-binding protein [Fructobacillus parabroussonetiae]MCK8617053.1 NAD(P)H-binding protein [Fructobacillus parabroussonetiae]
MNILILGAAGQISRMLIDRLLTERDDQLTLYARRADDRLASYADNPRVTIVDGDFSDEKRLNELMPGQDIVYVDSDKVVAPILKAMQENGVKRLIVAGVLGVYDEVGGRFGEWNRSMIGEISPERKQRVKEIEDSGLDYTYIRLTWLYNQPGNVRYQEAQKGTPFAGAQITRQAVVQYLMDLIADPKKDIKASVGLSEPGSEKLDKPSFY